MPKCGRRSHHGTEGRNACPACQRRLLAQHAHRRFLSVIAGTVPIHEFVDEANLERIIREALPEAT